MTTTELATATRKPEPAGAYRQRAEAAAAKAAAAAEAASAAARRAAVAEETRRRIEEAVGVRTETRDR